MRTITLVTAIFMNFVAVIYTLVIHSTIIEPYHIQPLSEMWIWLSIPALTLVGASTVFIIVEVWQERVDRQVKTVNLQLDGVIWLDKFRQ